MYTIQSECMFQKRIQQAYQKKKKMEARDHPNALKKIIIWAT